MWFFLLGLSSWILVEYLMHRFFLHRLSSGGHSSHHKDPKNKNTLFVEWYLVAVVSVVFCGIALLILDGVSVMWLYLGVVLGYFIYEVIHYRVHHCKAKTRLMKYLRRHHLQHHHLNEKGNFSVVFPPLDTLFSSRSHNSR